MFELKHTYTNIYDESMHFKTTPVGKIFTCTYPSQGTDQDDRIGNKINLTSLVLDGYISITGNSYPFRLQTDPIDMLDSVSGTFANGTGTIASTYNSTAVFKFPQAWYAKFRIFLVKYKPGYVITNPVAWFKKNFIYYDEAGTTYSNQCAILRESTEDTGKFSILSDFTVKLSLGSNSKHIKHVTKLNRTLVTFKDSASDTPTNLAYAYLIVPPLSQFDYSHSITDFPDTDISVASAFNLKLNYVDF